MFHCELNWTMTKSKHSQLFLVWLILPILSLSLSLPRVSIHVFYWDCFDVTSVFLLFPCFFFCSFTGMVYKTHKQSICFTYMQVMERMDRKTDELSIPLSIDRWKTNVTEDFVKNAEDCTARARERERARDGWTMLKIGFEIKWSLLTTAFIRNERTNI